MDNLFIIITILGWALALFYIAKLKSDSRKHHCPRCGREWVAKQNDADTVYHCKKCGLITYDSRRYLATFEDRSVNY